MAQDRAEGSLSRRGFLGRSSLGAGVLGAARLLPQAAEAAGAGVGPTGAARHPLDPLTADEIAEAARIVRAARAIGPSYRFVTIASPSRRSRPCGRPRRASPPPGRRPSWSSIDATGHSFEAIVDLRAAAIRSYEPVPAGLQPSITVDEFAECEAAIKRSPEFRAALRKRGVDRPGPGHGRRLVGRELRRRAARGDAASGSSGRWPSSAPSRATTATPGRSRA